MKRSAIVLAVMLVMALIPSAASAKKPADKPDKPNPNYDAPTTCAERDGTFWGPKGSADDGELLLQELGDCNDVSGLEKGSIFVFDFAATAASAPSDSGKSRGKGRPIGIRLAVRNSIGGDYCEGDWTVDSGDPVSAGNLLVDPTAVSTVTLIVTEELNEDGNCPGPANLFDDDPGHVVSAWTTGKLLDGSIAITLTSPSS